MEKNDRLIIIKIFYICMSLAILIRLFDLQILKGDEYREKSEVIKTRTIIADAPRGNIVDRFGRIIAENKLSYSVVLMKSNIDSEILNDTILAIVNIIKDNQDEFIDTLPILIDPVRFTYDDEVSVWKTANNIPQEATPMEAFQILRKRYDIPTDTNDVDAYSIISEDTNITLPFELDDTIYKAEKKLIKWKGNNNIEVHYTAQETLTKMLNDYKINTAKYDMKMARDILSIRYLLRQNNKNYIPIKIATDVSEKTRVAIEEAKIFLNGVSINKDTIRNYPNNQLSSHVVGYMNKINPDNIEEYLAKGYTNYAVVGQSGIEMMAEDKLRGSNGKQILEVDNKGNLLEIIDINEAVVGDTVFLTIDNELQKVAEKSLKTAMAGVKGGAISGGAVALDINTGEVLAMISEPGFDPNLFANGISTENWNSLQPKSNSQYEPKPLINNTISYPMPPGSTFKMLTGMGALQEGVATADTVYRCSGKYTAIANTTPGCAHGAVHGSLNMYVAIQRSCNIYFYEMGRRLGGSNFEKYAQEFGFGQKTGIELPFEFKGSIQGPVHKKDLYRDRITSYLQKKTKLAEENIKEISNYVDAIPPKKEVIKKLEVLGVTDKTIHDNVWNNIALSKWMPGDVLNASIGQGMNNATALQVANYVAIIANGGTRYEPHIIKKSIDSSGNATEITPKILNKVSISAANIKAIQEGMYRVINNGGTAGGSFNGTGIIAAGKTGTAEAGKYRPDPVNRPNYYISHPDHSWFVAYAPYDNPQIAVAVVIFQGGYGTKGIPVVRDIIKAYLTPKEMGGDDIIINDIIK